MGMICISFYAVTRRKFGKLKIAKVSAIFKKGDKNDFANYRPISPPRISKIFERVLHDQIYSFLETNDLLNRNQFGFRKHHSTDSAAIFLIEHILTELDKAFDSYDIFMDLSKAFDTIDHKTLIDKLHEYNFSKESSKLIASYLNNGQQLLNYRGVKWNFLPLKTGVHHGSILGPSFFLFLIYINDLPNVSNLFRTITYADDSTLLYTPNKALTSLEITRGINNELNKYNLWFRAKNLSLNINKTNFICFHGKRSFPHPTDNEIINK
jgi:hypothetical protein